MSRPFQDVPAEHLLDAITAAYQDGDYGRLGELLHRRHLYGTASALADENAKAESREGWHVRDGDGWRECDQNEPGAVYLSNSGQAVKVTPSMVIDWRG